MESCASEREARERRRGRRGGLNRIPRPLVASPTTREEGGGGGGEIILSALADVPCSSFSWLGKQKIKP